MTPALLTRPRVGRIPTRLLAEAGERIDWPVSLPVPSTAKFAAIDAPVPPLEPPGGAAEVVWVAHLTAQARNRHAPARELLHVRFGQDQRSRLAYPCHRKGVGGTAPMSSC